MYVNNQQESFMGKAAVWVIILCFIIAAIGLATFVSPIIILSRYLYNKSKYGSPSKEQNMFFAWRLSLSMVITFIGVIVLVVVLSENGINFFQVDQNYLIQLFEMPSINVPWFWFMWSLYSIFAITAIIMSVLLLMERRSHMYRSEMEEVEIIEMEEESGRERGGRRSNGIYGSILKFMFG